MRASRVLPSLLLASVVCGQRISEGVEPNESVATATPIACGQEAVGELGSATDEDWYSFVLTAAADLSVSTGPGPGQTVRDTVVTLLDGTGGPLRQNDDGVRSGWYSELFVPQLQPGTYFVAVAAGQNAQTGSGHSYQLDLTCRSVAAPPSPATLSEGPENNDPRTGGTATNGVVPVRCSGSLQTTGVGGDWDFWRLLVIGDSLVRIDFAPTGAVASGAAEDPVVLVYDAATPPNLVAGPFYASARDTWDQVLEFRLKGGLHQFAVRGMEGSQAGAYQFDVTATAAAAGLVFPGGCGGRTLSLSTTDYGPYTPLVREYPRFGSSYTVLGSGLAPFSFHMLGLQGQFVSLTPLGAIGCAVEVVPLETVFQLADPLGNAAWTTPIPDVPAFLGTQLHSQVVVWDQSNAFGFTTSNRVVGFVGN